MSWTSWASRPVARRVASRTRAKASIRASSSRPAPRFGFDGPPSAKRRRRDAARPPISPSDKRTNPFSSWKARTSRTTLAYPSRSVSTGWPRNRLKADLRRADIGRRPVLFLQIPPGGAGGFVIGHSAPPLVTNRGSLLTRRRERRSAGRASEKGRTARARDDGLSETGLAARPDREEDAENEDRKEQRAAAERGPPGSGRGRQTW